MAPPSKSMAEDTYVRVSLGTVLVTGGCGFLGSHIVSLLLAQSKAQKTDVHVVDLRPPSAAKRGATYHTADITSRESTRSILEAVRPDIIIHTVSPVFKSGGGKKNREFTWNVNVQGTRVLMDEAKLAGTRAFVYTSSASVISDQRTDLINADERWDLVRGADQPEYYSDTKAEAEALVLAASSRTPGPAGSPFLTTAIRPSAMFGELDVQMIPNMLKTLRAGQTKFQLGANENLFDFTYVGNVAHAHLLAAGRLLDLAKSVELKNGNGAAPAKAKAAAVKDEKDAADDNEDDDEDQRTRVDGEAFIITNLTPVYFWDFARALWNAYYQIRPTATPPATQSETWTLSRGFSLLIAQTASFVLSLVGRSPRLQPAAVRFSCMTRYFRTRKAEASLGYVPAFTLEEGIDRTVRWFAAREAEEEAAKEQKKDS